MNEPYNVSVVISTYNRCDMLATALESVLAQDTNGVRYEVIVVDNNSTDRTRTVVEDFIARGHSNLRYAFEGKQGLSHARNAGISIARAPIIAFTDDDVLAARSWVAEIKRTFDEHSEVDFAGGKVLPRWETEPPAWLTRDNWSPLALQDYGEAPFYVNAEKPICLVGANLYFRREVFERTGLFTPDFQRVKNGIGSTEDHEFLLRIWHAGGQGLYVPDIIVTADVQPDRFTKAYHRRWHTGHGKFCALMRLSEQFDLDGRLLEKPLKTAKLFGAPAFVYRELMEISGHWLKATLQRDKDRAFQHENRVRHLASYIRASRQHNPEKQSLAAELKTFAKVLLRRKATTVK